MLIDTKHGTKPRFLTPAICKDFAGNLFVAATYYNNENGYIGELVLYKIDPSGNKSIVGTRRMTRAKGDGVGICQSGSDILVVMGGHVSDPDTDLELLQAFTGVAVAYPTGMQPGHGGAQAFTETQSDPGGSGVTPEDIEAIATAVLGKVVQAFGGDIRRGIHDKAKQGVVEAIDEQGVLTLARTRAGGDAGYYRQQINTAYTGALGAIHDSSGFGGGHTQQTVAGPRPDSLDVNVSHAPFDSGQLGMTGQTEEGAQS